MLAKNDVFNANFTLLLFLHIVIESVLMLFVKVIEINLGLLKLQLAKIDTFFIETQCIIT